jgi:hypothetical protein
MAVRHRDDRLTDHVSARVQGEQGAVQPHRRIDADAGASSHRGMIDLFFPVVYQRFRSQRMKRQRTIIQAALAGPVSFQLFAGVANPLGRHDDTLIAQ